MKDGFHHWGCPKDHQFAVLKRDPDMYLLGVEMNCPRCEEKVLIQHQSRPGEVTVLPAKEFFAAVMGFGLPDERSCAPELVKEALVGRTITAVELERDGSYDRSVINSMTLDNGVTVHLASNIRGATIYKITGGDHAG